MQVPDTDAGARYTGGGAEGAMDRWEYRTFRFSMKAAEDPASYDRFGAEGWELAGLTGNGRVERARAYVREQVRQLKLTSIEAV